jgi:hypothetical protein
VSTQFNPEDSQKLLFAFRAAGRAWKSLQEYLKSHPDTPELINVMARLIAVIQHLKPLIDREFPDEEWPDTIDV